jgi:hypothetical protein
MQATQSTPTSGTNTHRPTPRGATRLGSALRQPICLALGFLGILSVQLAAAQSAIPTADSHPRLATSISLAAPALEASGDASKDDAEAYRKSVERERTAAELAAKLAPSLVRVEYWFKFDQGESTGFSYVRSSSTSRYSYDYDDSEELIREQRPLVVPGFVIAGKHSARPGHHGTSAIPGPN